MCKNNKIKTQLSNELLFFKNTFTTDIQLCNEKVLHNKVASPEQNNKILCYRLIPKGKKGFLWITRKENTSQSICYFIEVNTKTKQPIKSQDMMVCFDKKLTSGNKGTLLYGTIMKYKNSDIFSIEDIYFFKSQNVFNMNWGNKMQLFCKLFDDMYIRNIEYDKNTLNIFISPFYKNDLPIEYGLNNTCNDIYSIQYILKYKDNTNSNVLTYILKKQDLEKKCRFLIKSNIQEDIYELYCIDKNNSISYFNIANIPDYKTSVMMNKYFRNIKENYNLDALEESDDEDNFQNIDDEKYIFSVIHSFECIFCEKMRSWIPIKHICKIDDNNDRSFMKINNSKHLEVTKKYVVDTKEDVLSKMRVLATNQNIKNNKYNNPRKNNVNGVNRKTNTHKEFSKKFHTKYNRKSYKVNDFYKKK